VGALSKVSPSASRQTVSRMQDIPTKTTEMDLVRKGRLSVQRVDEKAWNAINMLTKEGGWEEMDLKPKKTRPKKAAVQGTNTKLAGRRGRRAKGKRKDEVESEDEEEVSDGEDEFKMSSSKTTRRKRKAVEGPEEGDSSARRPTKAKRS